MQLKIEREALKREKDSASKDRLAKLEKEIVNLEEQASGLQQRWEDEKAKLATAGTLRDQLDAARTESEQAQRKGDLAKAGELAYGVIPELEAKLKKIEEEESKGGGMAHEVVTPDLIAQVVSRWTGIPVDKMLEGEREKLLQMETQIAKRVVGQEEAVRGGLDRRAPQPRRPARPQPARSARSCSSARPASARPSLPARSPNSCSTTSTPSSASTCREYMEKHSVARLIGAPPGYVGYEEGGALTEAVRRRPYQVILFDEIEKAHPDVFNVLLQVLDDGRLTDGQGRTVDFRNTLIIMTSNLGSEYLVDQPEGEDSRRACASR